jgi:AcrR family transcriptional regulator
VAEPTKKRVRKTKPERRREIVQAALRIMSKHGYHGTSVARIAQAVGISNGALYQHFRNLDEVLDAATQMMLEQAHDWIVSPTGSTALERLDKIGASHLDWSARSVETFVRPVFAFVTGSERPRSEVSAPRSAAHSFGLLRSIVEDGQRDGSIRPDVEAGDLAWAVMMFAWAEDMALLSHVDEVTEGGASRRNFLRLLSTYAAPGTEDTVQP